jgi:HEPN domain-containing protein
MNQRFKPKLEWMRQAKYDLDSARAMFRAGRYIYTIFMCHLTIEKALKGLYSDKLKKDPPKVHNLNYFCQILKLKISQDQQLFIDRLNGLSVPTRYPDTLANLLKDYKKAATKDVLDKTGKLFLWLKQNKI